MPGLDPFTTLLPSTPYMSNSAVPMNSPIVFIALFIVFLMDAFMYLQGSSVAITVFYPLDVARTRLQGKFLVNVQVR